MVELISKSYQRNALIEMRQKLTLKERQNVETLKFSEISKELGLVVKVFSCH